MTLLIAIIVSSAMALTVYFISSNPHSFEEVKENDDSDCWPEDP